jgi:hypothetical protein
MLFANSSAIHFALSCPRVRSQELRRSGGHVLVELSGGRIVEATVKALVNKTDGDRLQVSFGNETALIYFWQIVEKAR